MEQLFKAFTVVLIHRNDNNEADDSAKIAAKNEELPEDLIYEVMTIPSIKKTIPHAHQLGRLESTNFVLSP